MKEFSLAFPIINAVVYERGDFGFSARNLGFRV
jgi:hypothetical protein